ncbi:MAG: hypothetical protein ACRCZ0_12005 [Cetobacterium sp.]
MYCTWYKVVNILDRIVLQDEYGVEYVIESHEMYAPCGIAVGDYVFRYPKQGFGRYITFLTRGLSPSRENKYINKSSEDRYDQMNGLYTHYLYLILIVCSTYLISII